MSVRGIFLMGHSVMRPEIVLFHQNSVSYLTHCTSFSLCCSLPVTIENVLTVQKVTQLYSSGTFDTQHTLYRGSLSSSEVVLICYSQSSYREASWTWGPVSSSVKRAIRVASAAEHENASISMEMDKERFSSEVYDGKRFPLRISPVRFGDSGLYTCFYDRVRMASITLVTIQGKFTVQFLLNLFTDLNK